MDKRPYASQSQLLNEQSNEITCGVTHDDGSIAATDISSQMDFQTMKAANDTAKVSVCVCKTNIIFYFFLLIQKWPIFLLEEPQNAA